MDGIECSRKYALEVFMDDQMIIERAKVGYIHEFLMEEKLPPNWMKAEGQILSIVEYPELYKVFGTIYGGDGETTFATPDFRERELDVNMSTTNLTYMRTYKAFKAKS